MINKIYYVREDVNIFYDEFDYEDDDNELLFMDLKDQLVFANFEICVKECPSKKKDKSEGTLVSSLHAIQDNKYCIINGGFSNHMTRDKINFIKLENYDGGIFIFGDDSSAKIC